jgi:branched-chain amino acid transport system substrate-binding protein
MKKLYLFLCLIIILSGCTQKKGTLNIGVILPLTGNAAIYGKDLKNGIDLAYEQSDLKDFVNLVYEDDAGDTKTGVNAINSLANKNIDIVIGGVMSSVASAILPIINSKKIFLLSPKATSLTLSKEDDYFFRIWPSDDYDGKIMANFLYDSLKIRKTAVFYVNLDYGVGLKGIFEKRFKELGGDIVFSEGYDNNRIDFRTSILKIKESKPEALFIPAYFKEAVLILKQLNENGCDFTIIGTSAFYEQDIKNAAAGLAEKSYFAYPLYSPESSDKLVVQFVKNFNDTYGEIPNAFSAHGYDSFKTLELAIKHLRQNNLDVTSTSIKEFFENVKSIEGVTGKFYFDENGDVVKDLRVLNLSRIFAD